MAFDDGFIFRLIITPIDLLKERAARYDAVAALEEIFKDLHFPARQRSKAPTGDNQAAIRIEAEMIGLELRAAGRAFATSAAHTARPHCKNGLLSPIVHLEASGGET